MFFRFATYKYNGLQDRPYLFTGFQKMKKILIFLLAQVNTANIRCDRYSGRCEKSIIAAATANQRRMQKTSHSTTGRAFRRHLFIIGNAREERLRKNSAITSNKET